MDIISKPFTERLVRDIDVVFLGGETASLTLYPEDTIQYSDTSVLIEFKSKERTGVVELVRRNMCTLSHRERTVQEPITEPPVPPTKDTTS